MSAMLTNASFTDASLPPIDFLAIGHVCYDLTAAGRVVGGAAAYSAAAAQALGCRTGIVTSAADQAWQRDLPDIAVHVVEAPATTIFENRELPGGRRQIVHAVAGPLSAGDVPPLWTRTPMVLLGPIAGELRPAIVESFPDNLIGVAPQGWMRGWDGDGRVRAIPWASAAAVLPLSAVAFLSREDLPDPSLVQRYAELAHILVITDGASGCTVYFNGERRSFAAPQIEVVDTTGAGDIFAAAYLVRLRQTEGNMWEAAEFANRVAALSVTRAGVRAKTGVIHEMAVRSLNRTG
jgi:hypothetical protein